MLASQANQLASVLWGLRKAWYLVACGTICGYSFLLFFPSQKFGTFLRIGIQSFLPNVKKLTTSKHFDPAWFTLFFFIFVHTSDKSENAYRKKPQKLYRQDETKQGEKKLDTKIIFML